MKKAITLILILCSLSAFSQTVRYELDTVSVKGKEFYLNEIVTEAASDRYPKPEHSVKPLPFTDTTQIKQYIFAMRSEAKKASEEAQRILNIANNLMVKAAEMEAFVSKNAWLSGKKSVEVAKK